MVETEFTQSTRDQSKRNSTGCRQPRNAYVIDGTDGRPLGGKTGPVSEWRIATSTNAAILS
jgi:hypothetical protein